MRKLLFFVLVIGLSSLFAEKMQENGEEHRLGRAKLDDVFELNFMGGLANKLYAYSVAYTRIVNSGRAEVTIPMTLWKDALSPEDTSGTAKISNSSNTLFAIGLKYRVIPSRSGEGLFYGGGIRINYIITQYQRDIPGSGLKDFQFVYPNFIPLAEIGFKENLATEWGYKVSAEGGWIFSDYDNLNNLKGNETGTPKGDPGRTPVYGKTQAFWTVNVGIFYAF